MEWATIWLTIKGILAFMVTTGTNELYIAMVLKNILLFGTIVLVTPWTWDNKLFNAVKKMISNFRNKGEDVNKPDVSN